jgi:hypothetical protein
VGPPPSLTPPLQGTSKRPPSWRSRVGSPSSRSLPPLLPHRHRLPRLHNPRSIHHLHRFCRRHSQHSVLRINRFCRCLRCHRLCLPGPHLPPIATRASPPTSLSSCHEQRVLSNLSALFPRPVTLVIFPTELLLPQFCLPSFRPVMAPQSLPNLIF